MNDLLAATYAVKLMLINTDATKQAVAIKLLKRLEDSEAKQNLEFTECQWHRWVQESLEKGAGKAHRWTNQPNQKVADVKAKGKTLPQDIVETIRDE